MRSSRSTGNIQNKGGSFSKGKESCFLSHVFIKQGSTELIMNYQILYWINSKVSFIKNKVRKRRLNNLNNLNNYHENTKLHKSSCSVIYKERVTIAQSIRDLQVRK